MVAQLGSQQNVREKKLDGNNTRMIASCFESILEAAPLKTAVVQPLASYHKNQVGRASYHGHDCKK